MSLYQYLNRIRRLDGMIRRKSTGPPTELAKKLNISERWLYVFLEELKEELDCPIRYDRHKRSYVYEEDGKMVVGFQHELSSEEEKQITGGGSIEKFIHCIYFCSSSQIY